MTLVTILSATFIGSQRHLHKYAQETTTYVRAYGRPDLFITFKCNKAWTEIKKMISNKQSAHWAKRFRCKCVLAEADEGN